MVDRSRIGPAIRTHKIGRWWCVVVREKGKPPRLISRHTYRFAAWEAADRLREHQEEVPR